MEARTIFRPWRIWRDLLIKFVCAPLKQTNKKVILMEYLDIYNFGSAYSKRGEEGRRRTMDTKAILRPRRTWRDLLIEDIVVGQ